MKSPLLKRVLIFYLEKCFQLLSKKNKSFLFISLLAVCMNVSAQQITVNGKVTSADSVLAGVTVRVKNKNNNTQTDNQGNYSIATDPNSILVFSYVGFISQEIEVSNRSLINIELQTANQQLNDVVVVGYGTQRKGSITGAVSSIKSSDLMRTPSATTSSALVGKVQGITARMPTGRPGAATDIQIRNLGSPLFVIDGVPQSEGQFNNIGMEDIESISILKDASATVYGFRASNGVVLVTTKKGKAGRSNINVSSYYGMQNLTRYLSASDAYTYVRALAEAEQNEGKVVSTTPEILGKWRQGTETGFQGTDYLDYIIHRNAPQQYINISANGGSDKMNYYFSMGHLNQDAILRQYNFKRSNFQANVEGTILRGLKIGTQLSGRIEGRHEPASTTGGNTYDNPFLAILTMWPTERLYANDNPNYINADVNNPSRNPLIYDKSVIGKQDNVWHNFGSIFYTSLDLPFGLSAKATYSFNYKQNKNELHRYSFNTYSYKPATRTYEPVPFNLALRNKARREIQENFAQLQLNYKKDLGEHGISAMGAYEYASSVEQFASINASPPTNYSPIIALLEVNGLTDEYFISKRASFIGRFNYDFKQKYLLELLGRYDGSHLFAPGKRWGLFPGISAGWRLSQEDFIRDNIPVISNLKLRASWGRTGQERGLPPFDVGYVAPFDYLEGGNFRSGNYVFDGGLVSGTGIRGLPITSITWVTSMAQNIGLDFGLFNNKLTGEFDVFTRKLSGIPTSRYDVLLPSEVGYALPLENLNSEITKGIEGIITYANNTRKISYSISVNGTLGRRKILDIYKPRFGNSWDEYRGATANRWADINWGYRVEGQFQSMDQIKNWTVNNDGKGNTTQLPGDLIFKDENGDGMISNLDERPIGYALGATPYMSFGANAGISYRGLSLMTDWAGGTMQSYYRIFELAIPFQAIHNAPEYLFNNRWHREDLFDPNSAWIPGRYPAIRRTGSGSHVNYTNRSDYWITNVHYIRLKNLEIAYNLPDKLIRRAHLSAVRIYCTGTNLFSFDNVKHIEIDPEIAFNTGLVYPSVRVYTFGINLTF